jgi:pilus assembly protein CpaC
MSISMNSFLKVTYRSIAPVMLCGLMQAQTAAATPAPPLTAALNVATLPGTSAALTSSTEFASRTLHVLVGRSVFIRTQSRLKRVYVSNPMVLDSFTSSPVEIVVTARSPGVCGLILWDEAGESETYLVSSDLDVASLQQEIHQALPNDNIKVGAQQGRVSLSGAVFSDADSEAAAKLAGLYAKDVVNSLVVKQPHVRQVKLKVQIIEIDRSKLDEFGINFFSGGKNTSATQTGQFSSINTTATANPPTLSVSSPLNLLFYSSSLNVGLTVQDLQDLQVAQILAEPAITALSGQKASFLSGGEFPFPVVQGSSGGLTSITIQFRSYGVKLDFTPIVNDDGTIQLTVAPEVSALDYTNAVTISGYTIPAISTRRAQTEVELRDGQSFAISGLLDRRTTDIFNKMPGIGDIPILGQFFRSKNINHSLVELMVVVTPTIVNPLTEAAAPTLPKLPVPMLDPKQFDKKTGKWEPQPPSGTGGPQ